MSNTSYESLESAALRLDVTPRTIRRWIAAGELPAFRFSAKLIRVRIEDIDALGAPIPTARAL
jgi:excisionase family DNA binding protein